MAKIVELEIKDVVIPQGFLPRVLTGTVEEKVEEYKELLEEGVEFDPILVWEKEDGQYWVIDGVHRIEAHKRAGKERIKAKLLKCKDELDYRIKAIQANLKHGLALAKGERPILAQTLYRQGLSEEEIRKVFGVSKDTVRKWLAPVKQEEKQAKIRKALELRERGLSIREIAKELGEPKTTIERWLSQSGNFSQIGTPELLLPTGAPTPEGLKLFSEFVEQTDIKTPNDAFNESGFYSFLKNKGYEVEYHGQFIATVREEIDTYVKKLVDAGMSETAIRTALSRENAGIFRHISSTAKAKLAGLLSDYIHRLIKEREERQKEESLILETAGEILQNPEFVFSSWYNLGKLVLERLEEKGQGLSHRYHAANVSQILQKHSNTLLDIYNSIPEISEEELREIARSFDLDEFEDLIQFRETLRATVIQRGKRPAGADTYAVSLWNEYQSKRLKEASLPTPPSSEALEDSPAESSPPDESKEEENWDEILKPFAEAYDRVFGKNEEKQEEEQKPKLKRGRPPKEGKGFKEMTSTEQYLWAITQIEYWTLWILDRWGREEAIKVLKTLLKDLENLTNEQLADAWREAFALALADKRIRGWEYWQ